MTDTILDMAACLARITTNDTEGWFKTAQTAFDMNPLEDTAEMPAVFIYPGYVDADPIGDGAVRQRVHDTLILDVICNVDDLRTAVEKLRSWFLGWEMGEEYGPFRLAFTGHMQGQACGPMELKGGVIHWQERYQNNHHTRLIHN